MTISVDDLVGDPVLRTKYLAGRGGGRRVISWAHTCELPEPWNWLAPGDLLLVDGYGFPSAAQAQVDFITQLFDADIAGVAVAEGLFVPRLTDAVLAQADALAFPILQTEYNVPFVSVARAVARASNDSASTRITKTQRLYNVLRRSHVAQDAGDGLLDLLSAEIGARLRVVSVRTALPVLPADVLPSDGLRDAIITLIEGHSGRLPAFNRLTVEDTGYFVMPVGSGKRAALVADAHTVDGTPPDLALLQHVAAITDVEVEIRAAMEIRRRARATSLLRQLVEGTVPPDLALRELGDLGLGEGPWRAVLWSSRNTLSDLEAVLFDAGVPMLHQQVERGHLVFVASRTPEDAFASPLLALHAVCGASRLIHNLARVPDGVREARWALEAAGDRPGQRVVYGDHVAPFFPRSIAEAEEVVRQILGPAIEYDKDHSSELVRTLEVLFETNRSWQEAAKRLGIHRQTLVYRIRRIEQVTRYDLNVFRDQAELYFAIRSWRMLQSD